MMAREDLYEILGISSSASLEEIKSSYRDLVKKFHPDIFPNYIPKLPATKKMQEINSAYAVLSDPGRRRVYDQYRGQLFLMQLVTTQWKPSKQRVRRKNYNWSGSTTTRLATCLATFVWVVGAAMALWIRLRPTFHNPLAMDKQAGFTTVAYGIAFGSIALGCLLVLVVVYAWIGGTFSATRKAGFEGRAQLKREFLLGLGMIVVLVLMAVPYGLELTGYPIPVLGILSASVMGIWILGIPMFMLRLIWLSIHIAANRRIQRHPARFNLGKYFAFRPIGGSKFIAVINRCWIEFHCAVLDLLLVIKKRVKLSARLFSPYRRL